MPVGTCRLCKLEKDLVNSHFLPAALYKPLHAEGLDVNEPMMITAKRVIQSSRQITAHTFCAGCEAIFNNGGEAWVLHKLATLTVFPLRDMVLTSPPMIDESDFKVFSCDRIAGFQTEKVVHLAMGIFWKATVGTWNITDGPPPRIELGPYEEPIRQFVLGAGPFPTYVCLVAFLDASTPPLIAITPPRRFRREEFHLFAFYMNGLQCLLCVGKKAPLQFWDSCMATAPHHPIFLVPEAGNSMFEVMKPFTTKSRPSKGILKTFEQWKTLRGKI